MLLADLGQLLNALQHVGRVAQGVFDALGGGVAGAGKGTEGRHIGEVPLAELACVIGNGSAQNDVLGGLQNVRGELQAGGKIVGGAGGNVADGGIEA